MQNDSANEICGFGVYMLFKKIIRLNITEQQLNISFLLIIFLKRQYYYYNEA